MAGKLTTHILDIAAGKPAAGVRIDLHRFDQGTAVFILTVVTNSDGRTDEPLLEGVSLQAGIYELTFHIGNHFNEESGFLDQVPVRFRVGSSSSHYHVPLVCSPWAYSTYRGS